MQRYLSFLSLLGLAVLVSLHTACIPAAASVQGSFQRTLQVNGPVTLEVFTHSGDIIVRSGSAGTVSISGKIHVGDNWFSGSRSDDVHALEQNPPIHQSGNSIRVDYPGMRNISIDYEITVPADTNLRSHTGSGNQTVQGIHQNLDLEAGSGDIELDDIKGDVRSRTGSGNVHARNMAGSFSADAGSGDIRLEETSSGTVRAHTGSGNVEAHGVNGELRVDTGSGDVRVEGKQAGTWELRTGSGDVEITIPKDAAFDLNARTSSGSVVVDHPVTMTIQGDVQRSHRTVEGKVRGGGPEMVVHTGSGDIHVY